MTAPEDIPDDPLLGWMQQLGKPPMTGTSYDEISGHGDPAPAPLPTETLPAPPTHARGAVERLHRMEALWRAATARAASITDAEAAPQPPAPIRVINALGETAAGPSLSELLTAQLVLRTELFSTDPYDYAKRTRIQTNLDRVTDAISALGAGMYQSNNHAPDTDGANTPPLLADFQRLSSLQAGANLGRAAAGETSTSEVPEHLEVITDPEKVAAEVERLNAMIAHCQALAGAERAKADPNSETIATLLGNVRDLTEEVTTITAEGRILVLKPVGDVAYVEHVLAALHKL